MTDANKHGIMARVDENFLNEIDKIWKVRMMKDLETVRARDIGVREATRMMTKTENWQNVVRELTSKTRKKDDK